MYNLVKKEVWFSRLKALLLWESHASFYLSKMNAKKAVSIFEAAISNL